MAKYIGSLKDSLQLPTLSVSSALVSRTSQYLVLALNAQLLSPSDFGAFALLTVLLAIVSAIGSGGGDMWLNRFTWHTAANCKRAPRIWRVYLLTCLACGVATFVISLGGIVLFGGDYTRAALIALVAGVILGMAEALLAVLRASNLLTTFFVLRDFIAPLGYVGLIATIQPTTVEGAFLVFLGVTLVILLCAGFAIAINAGTLLPVVPTRRGTWSWVCRHTLGLVVGNLSSRLAIYIDVLALGFFVNLTDIGEYRVAAQVAIGFTIIQHFFFLGLPWQIRQTGMRHAMGRGFAGVLKRQRLLLLLSLCGLLVAWPLADEILAILGDRFRNIGAIFRILMALRLVELLWGPQHEILVSKGHLIQDVISNLLSLAAWGVTFILVSIDPLHGAVLANVVASVVRHLYRHAVLSHHNMAQPFGHPFGIWLPLACCGTIGFILLTGA